MTRPTAFSVRFNHSRNICKAPAPPKNNNNAKGKKGPTQITPRPAKVRKEPTGIFVRSCCFKGRNRFLGAPFREPFCCSVDF
jgi:hypothetical protein